ncbi:MAG: ABC transporter permease subunit [Desulfovibrio sp.]|nr:ABC transporter permease subunit [Desulfovibrio sp.]
MTYAPHWDVLLEDPYPGILLNGLATTLELALVSTLASLVLGSLLAVGRASESRLARRACGCFCDLVRSLPGVFWLLAFFFCLPLIVPEQAGLALNGWDGFPFWAAAAGLSVNNSPYVADILYAVMGQAGRGAMAAARLSGLSGPDFWGRVALPQAYAASMPALSARLLHNLKNTSLAMVVSVPELTWASQEVESLSFAGLEVTTAATCIYAGLGFAFSLFLMFVERRLHRAARTEETRV